MKLGACSKNCAKRRLSSAARRAAVMCAVVSAHTTKTPPTPEADEASTIGL